MKSRVLLIGLIAGTMFGALFLPQAIASEGVSEESYAGWIEEIRPPAYLKHDAASKAMLLDPKRDRFRRLYVGERLRCDHGGTLRLQLYGEMTEIKDSPVWFPVPHVPSPRPNLKRQALDFYGRLGGRERGDFLWVFSPANESSVRVENFVIRWNSQAGLATVSMTIEDEAGRRLWGQDGVNGGIGQFVSEAARQAVGKYRDAGGEGPLTLVLLDSGGSESRVSFFPLSVQAGEVLDQELGMWDKEVSSLMRHVCRAYSFARRRMFTEVADEYEAALEVEPDSQDLLAAAIEAHRRTGNSERVRELTQRLSAHP
jgi:hypothetical protein